MFERKKIKQRAKQRIKKHYIMFVLLCLLAGVIGVEFTASLSDLKAIPRIFIQETEEIDENTNVGLAGSFSFMDSQKEEIFNDLLEGNVQGANDRVSQSVDYSKKHDTATLGRRRGAFSHLVNQVTSGGFITSMVVGLDSIVGARNINVVIIMLLLLAVSVIYYIFVQNIFAVIMRRLFLESRCYDKVNYGRGFFLFHARCWIRACISRFNVGLCLFLWWLTIIGGIIKSYSYRMADFIIAENPTLTGRQVRKLSRQMMNGHKWECFKIDLSLLGWSLLGNITFGVSNILFTNPYKIAINCEYYDYLRTEMLKKSPEMKEYFIDTYLFEKPDKELLEVTYADVLFQTTYTEVLKEEGADKEIELHNFFTKFMANIFGVLFIKHDSEKNYDEAKAREVELNQQRLESEGVIYPARLTPLTERKKRKALVTKLNYMRRYNIWSLIIMFFILCFVGWSWEVSLHLLQEHRFVNRGVLHGPWLPIYGTGGIMMILALYRFRKSPLQTFLLGMLLSGVVEYFTAVYLEYAYNGKKWWDYTGYFLNIHGKCCAEGLLVFGLGGLGIIYVLAPVLDALIKKIPYKLVIILSIVLVVVFAWDQIYSSKHPNEGEGITDYKSAQTVILVQNFEGTGGIGN